MKLHWTRNKYKRGILLEQDKIAEFQTASVCKICGKTKERKRYRDGKLEPSRAFRERKTCGRFIGDNGEFQAGNCLRVIPCGKRWVLGQDNTWLKDKTFDELYGEEKSRLMRKKLSDEMNYKLAIGKIDVSKPKVESVCSVCGKVTLDSPWRAKNRIVCSLKCAGSKCGRAEWVKNNYEKFVEQQKSRRKGEYKICLQCKNEFYLHPSTAKILTGNFCSKKCELDAHRLTKSCQKCGTLFVVRKSESWKIKNCVKCRKLAK